MFSRFLLVVLFVFGFGAAQASTIDGTGFLVSSGNGTFAFSGAGTQFGSTDLFLVNVDDLGNFSAIAPSSGPPPLNLVGNLLTSTVFGTGFIEMIFAEAGGSLAADFPQILVRIDSFGPFDASTPLPFDSDATFSITPVPLPAGLPLLLGGLAGLALIRRRRSTQKA